MNTNAMIEFEKNTIAFTVEGEPVTIAEARAMFDKYHKGHWKDPVNAVVPYVDLPTFIRAVQFYQGCEPEHTICTMEHLTRVNADIKTAKYRVTSPGYVC